MATPTSLAGRWVAISAAIAMLTLAGCGPFGGAEATPMPTRTPLPTFTATPEGAQPPAQPDTSQPAQPQGDQGQVAAVPTQDQTQTQTQTQPAGDTIAQPGAGTPAAAPPAAGATVTPTTATAAAPPTTAAPEVVTNDIVNIRRGPGTNYDLIGSAQIGTKFKVTGKNQGGDWWQIDYNGQPGWVFGQIVSVTGAEAVAVAQNIPAPPTPAPIPPTNTPGPQPTAVAQAPAPAPKPADNFPFILGENTATCAPNPGITYFNGFARDSNNNPINGVCIHLAFFGPRTTKCSGCDGVGDGNWGFSPFGSSPAPRGTAVEIFVVGCPGPLPPGGQSSGFGDLTPQSQKWTRVINDSEQCTGITFYKK